MQLIEDALHEAMKCILKLGKEHGIPSQLRRLLLPVLETYKIDTKVVHRACPFFKMKDNVMVKCNIDPQNSNGSSTHGIFRTVRGNCHW